MPVKVLPNVLQYFLCLGKWCRLSCKFKQSENNQVSLGNFFSKCIHTFLSNSPETNKTKEKQHFNAFKVHLSQPPSARKHIKGLIWLSSGQHLRGGNQVEAHWPQFIGCKHGGLVLMICENTGPPRIPASSPKSQHAHWLNMFCFSFVYPKFGAGFSSRFVMPDVPHRCTQPLSRSSHCPTSMAFTYEKRMRFQIDTLLGS